MYGEYIRLQIHRSTNGGQSARYIYRGISDAGSGANFIAPFILDPNDQRRLLAGGRRLWRTTNARASTVQWRSIRSAGSDNLSAIAVAPGNATWRTPALQVRAGAEINSSHLTVLEAEHDAILVTGASQLTLDNGLIVGPGNRGLYVDAGSATVPTQNVSAPSP